VSSKPVTGGISQISELRAGHNDFNGNFVPATSRLTMVTV